MSARFHLKVSGTLARSRSCPSVSTDMHITAATATARTANLVRTCDIAAKPPSMSPGPPLSTWSRRGTRPTLLAYQQMAKRRALREDWAELGDEELLDLRMADLPADIEGTLADRIAQLRSELDD